MNEWQPISTYDAMKVKPERAVFYFKAMGTKQGSRYGLLPTIEKTRTFGIRTCTHWIELPPPPKEISL